MKIEHFAINVEHPVEMADWYIENLGLKPVKRDESAPYTTFLADDSGQVMVEFYRNPPDEVPDYENMNPLILHLAFSSNQPNKEMKRLVGAGASLVSDDVLADGSHIVMLRDPWGFPIQLCKRSNPMLTVKE